MRNLTMMTDLYQLTMMQGYLKNGMQRHIGVFNLFYRKQSETTSYAIAAGLEQAVQFVKELCFTAEDLAYLRSLSLFDEVFLAYLSSFRFTGDIDAVAEGTVVFPGEPIVRVRAPLMEAQLLETALLNLVNHQTLIATTAARVCLAADGDDVSEFGLRRAQGPDAGIYGARAAIIGGCGSTSNVLAGKLYGVPVRGTHAHSWVMSFPSELEAFRAYARAFPQACLLLVDTYSVLKSGVPNAITVFRELRQKGCEPLGVRLDSGDLCYLSQQTRRMLDEAGFPQAKIFASGDLDEEIIWQLKAQGAAIDVWGVGTRLITSEGNPALGGVYKLAAEIVDGKTLPRMKISENPAKVTNPGVQTLYRVFDRANGMAVADLIALEEECYDESQPLTLFDPVDPWKAMTLTNYRLQKLLLPIFREGRQVYRCPSLPAIQAHCREGLSRFWPQYKRLHQPHRYKVDLSRPLYDLKQKLLGEISPR